jgi:hypothetical protein
VSQVRTAFDTESLKFVRPMSPYRHGDIARVWEVEADSCHYAVKLVKSSITDISYIASDPQNSSSLIRILMQIGNEYDFLGQPA